MTHALLPAERRTRIIDAVRDHGVVSTERLAELLDVSTETVRRDLVMLGRSGHVARVHGGATRSETYAGPQEPSYSTRLGANAAAKAAIGIVAAALLLPGQTVVIDIGTTALAVAQAIPQDYRGIIATPSLLAAAELTTRAGVEVLVCGGRVRAGDLACSNASANAFFGDLRADVALLGSGAFDAGIGLTDYYLDEVAMRKIIIANTIHNFILADHSKLGRSAPHRVCSLKEVDGLLTDTEPPEDVRHACEVSGAAVIIAN